MAEFIDKLPTFKVIKLLEAMRYSSSENIVSTAQISCYGNKLYVVHGIDNKGQRIESVYTDYVVEKIYGDQPSTYDQFHFQAVMTELIDIKTNRYETSLKAYCEKNNLPHVTRIKFGEEDEDEVYDDEYEEE